MDSLIAIGSSFYNQYASPKSDFELEGYSPRVPPYSDPAYFENSRSDDSSAALGGNDKTAYGAYCCPLVMDYMCLALILGGIAAATAFLGGAVIPVEIMMPRRKRRSNPTNAGDFLRQVSREALYEWFPELKHAHAEGEGRPS